MKSLSVTRASAVASPAGSSEIVVMSIAFGYTVSAVGQIAARERIDADRRVGTSLGTPLGEERLGAREPALLVVVLRGVDDLAVRVDLRLLDRRRRRALRTRAHDEERLRGIDEFVGRGIGVRRSDEADERSTPEQPHAEMVARDIIERLFADVALRIAAAWAVAAALQLGLWLVARRTRNAGIVDVGWAGSFSVIVALFVARAPAPASGWLPIAAIVVAWSMRLTLYLIGRGAATGPEEGRYVDLRARWGERADRRFFVFFQAQAALAGLLSAAFVVPFVVAPERGWLVWAGALVSAVGVVGEALADAQLARFKRASSGGVCEVGLWALSRHPNYFFFEWCVWLGYAIHGLAFGYFGLIALVPQAIIFASIFGVTGIPPTENHSDPVEGRRVSRRIKRRVSKFIPWPPKRAP